MRKLLFLRRSTGKRSAEGPTHTTTMLALTALLALEGYAHGGVRASRVARPASAPRADIAAKIRVAVVGGGPSGSCAAEILAQEPNVETYLIERKMDNAKPCGGAIPLCMVDEFQLPPEIIDRKVRRAIRLLSSRVRTTARDVRARPAARGTRSPARTSPPFAPRRATGRHRRCAR